jgi:hypothetical protein
MVSPHWNLLGELHIAGIAASACYFDKPVSVRAATRSSSHGRSGDRQKLETTSCGMETLYEQVCRSPSKGSSLQEFSEAGK